MALETQVLEAMREKHCSKQPGLLFGISQGCCPAVRLCPLPTPAIKPRPCEQPEPQAVVPADTQNHCFPPTAQHPSDHEGIFFLDTLFQEGRSKSPKNYSHLWPWQSQGLGALAETLSHHMGGTALYTEKRSCWPPKRPGFVCCLHSIPCSQEQCMG